MALTKVSTGMLSADAASVDLNIDAGTMFIDASANRVGIGNTSPATALDVTGTVTADGLTVANTSVVAGDFDGGTAATYIRLQDDTDNFLFGSNNSLGNFLIKNETADALRLSVANTGDISFYEDTGTTAKLFWDASAESLGIGTASPVVPLSVKGSQEQLTLSEGDLRGATFDYQSSTGALHISTNGANARTSPQFTLDLNGSVGIGTDSPAINKGSGTAQALHLYASAAAPELRIQRGNGTDFSITASTTGGGANFFSSHAMTFYTNNGTRAFDVDTSGNLIVSGTSAGDATSVALHNGGYVHAVSSHQMAGIFDRRDSDGDIVVFRKDGSATAVGSIGTLNTNRLYFGGADTGIMIASDLDCIYPTNGGDTARNNAVDLGNSGTRFKDLYLSGTANAGSVLKVNSSVDGTEASPHFQIQAAASTYQLNYWLDGTAAYMGQNSALRSLRLYSSAETAGVQLSAGGTSWGTFSDERLKENVEPVENALQSLSGLRTVKYHLKDVDGPEDKKKIGVIAQDLVGVLDEVIDPAFRSDDDTEYMSVRYTELVPVLIKAIQEQQATIESLTARIAALES